MRARFTLFLSLLLIPALCNSQAPKSWDTLPEETESAKRAFPAQLRGELSQIRDAALLDDYAYQQLEHLTDSIGPRPTGSPQADAAVQYVAEELRKLGLEVHLEPVPVIRFVRGNDSAELVEYPGQVPGTTQRIYITALYGNAPTSEGGIRSEVIVAHDFNELKALGKQKVAGKIVLWNVHYDSRKAVAGQAGSAYRDAVEYRSVGARAAADLGAIASVVRSAGDGEFRLPHTGWSTDAHIPAAAVSAEDADLMARLALRGPVRVHLSLPTRAGQAVQSYNVVADLKGSEHPEQVVIVSGHLDSWDLGTGAIDDGAGVVVAMEAAEIVQRLHLRPRRTLRVIAWMDEENGGAGSQTYTKDHSAEFSSHVAAIESDSGAAHPLGFELRMTPQAAQLLQPVAGVLQSFGATVLQSSPFPPGADIAAMSDAGVPALGLMQDGRTYFHYHHTAADTLDKIVPSELRENAAAMAVMGYALASMKDPLPR